MEDMVIAKHGQSVIVSHVLRAEIDECSVPIDLARTVWFS